jgi:uncharacterized protein DUF3455
MRRALQMGCFMTISIACAPADTVRPSADAHKAVPSALAVPAGQALLLRASARGAQIYTCRPEGWVLKAPEADLFDADGKRIGKHYGGPTWELDDGSAVVGEVKEKAPAEGSIPWLLLAKKSARGTGTLSRVTFIQRLDTQGGTAPAGGCDATKAGAEARVEYTATYAFYAAG